MPPGKLMVLAPMQFLVRRTIATFTALFVFITSMNCVCQGSFLRFASIECHDEEAIVEKACCQHQHEEEENESSPCHHDGSGNHDPACNHCKNTLLANESTSNQHFSDSLSLSLLTPTLDTTVISTPINASLIWFHCYGDLPPPVDRPTLLSLGCLLTT